MPETQEGHYTVKTVCSNCGNETESVIRMGTAVREAKCDECGCKGHMYRKSDPGLVG